MRLALFDFDGTITKRDSLFDFLIYLKGWPKFILGIVLLSPTILLWKLGKIDTQRAKESLFKYFFGGESYNVLLEKGKIYLPKLEKIINDSAMLKISLHKSTGDDVVVVTASSAPWVLPWCQKNSVELICSKLAVKDGFLTGKIEGKNCNGQEKANQITQRYNLDQYSIVYAYGNSTGDDAMLNLADEKFYRCFQ